MNLPSISTVAAGPPGHLPQSFSFHPKLILFRYSIGMLRILLLTGLLASVIPSLQAQSFSLKGIVLDALSDEPLPGVTITTQKGKDGTITDSNGVFYLTDIDKAQIELQFFLIGYQKERILYRFEAGSTEILTVKLKIGGLELEQLEVTAKAEGQIKAMLEQKRSESIKNIVSAEQIATFPDLNAAEVMQRIPGITLRRDQSEGRFVQLRGTPPELTNFNINGEQIPSPQGGVRYVGMDIIPADQIDFIEVSKVMTPDMDADGIGGSVNIKTKEATTSQPDIRATFTSGYNSLRSTPNYQFQYSYGQRVGRFGFNLNSSFFRNSYGSENIEYEFAKGPFFGSQGAGQNNYFVQIREAQLRSYDITRTRISVAPTFDYRFNKNSYIYLKAMYNRFRDDELRYRKIVELDDAVTYDYYLYGGIIHDSRKRDKIQQLSTLSLGGEHQLAQFKIDYQLFAAFAEEGEPDRIETSFDNPGSAIGVRLDFTDPNFPKITIPKLTDSINATDYGRFQFDNLLRESRQIFDVNYTPRINLTYQYHTGREHKGYLKFGGKIRAKNKKRDIESEEFAAYFKKPLAYPDTGPELSLLTVQDGWQEPNLLRQGYRLDNMPSPDKMRDFFEFYPHHFVYDRNGTKTQSFGEDYQAQERIYAAYAMWRHDYKQLMMIGGLRFEQTNIQYQGAKVITDGNKFIGIDTLRDARTHAFLLPQLQLKYALNDQINIRAAVTYTYSRPNFDDVLPYREEDRDEVKFGNPNLRYPKSTNFDLLAERYYKKGLLSAGVFFKRIDDFIFYFKRFAHEGDPKDYSLVEISKAVNGDQASVYGAEFQYQAKLDFLPGILRHLGVYTNYTYTYSQAFIPKRTSANFTDAVVVFGEDDAEINNPTGEKEKIAFPGQARHTTNVSLFYDSKKLLVRVTGNYHDSFLFQLGADPDLDEYYKGEFRLDLNANYDVSKHLNVFVDLINLTNTPQRYYLGTPDRIKQQEYYSWWGRLGFKFKF